MKLPFTHFEREDFVMSTSGTPRLIVRVGIWAAVMAITGVIGGGLPLIVALVTHKEIVLDEIVWWWNVLLMIAWLLPTFFKLRAQASPLLPLIALVFSWVVATLLQLVNKGVSTLTGVPVLTVTMWQTILYSFLILTACVVWVGWNPVEKSLQQRLARQRR